MAEVNEESLWLSSGAYNLVSSCGQGKILVLSSWPRSTNVNSVDGPFQDAEARKLVMCSDAEPNSHFYCTMPGNYLGYMSLVLMSYSKPRAYTGVF